MYRLDGDVAWRDLVLRTLQMTTRQLEQSMQDARSDARRFGPQESELAFLLNQYAWLVSNTEGDYQKALNLSLESIAIEPDAAKLDTCGRCYFAVGDYDSAIRMQRRALKQMPHSPPLLRQLAQFEAARKEQSEAEPKTAP
jgi:tetratricopeptide (TPR) repeat protein